MSLQVSIKKDPIIFAKFEKIQKLWGGPAMKASIVISVA